MEAIGLSLSSRRMDRLLPGSVFELDNFFTVNTGESTGDTGTQVEHVPCRAGEDRVEQVLTSHMSLLRGQCNDDHGRDIEDCDNCHGQEPATQ